MLSVLVALTKADQHSRNYNLTELTQVLSTGSRKLAFDAVERLSKAGWISKHRVSKRTGYQIADEGVRQLQRLAAATDGPVRSAIAPR